MAARWFRASKDGTSFRFVPRFAPLEDRCVPATYYVDPVLLGSTNGAAVTFDAGHVNATPGLVYAGSSAFALANPAANAFGSLRAALDAAAGNADPADTVLLATGQIPLDNSATTLALPDGGSVNSVPVTQALTLRGDGAGATAITPTADTRFFNGEFGGPDPFTSVFRIDGPAASLDASNFRFDGGGRNLGVGFSVQNGASGRFDGVAVTGVAFSPSQEGGDTVGTAVAANAAKSLSFARCSVSGYGRAGLLFVATPGSVTDSTVVGRGAGALVNNGVELQSGSVVSVTGNRVADNAGVARDGSLSSGLLVLDDGLGTNPSKALAVGNTFAGNGVALNVGAATPDGSTLDAAYNTLIGNGLGASGLGSKGVQNLARNWWGDASGPFDAAAPGGKGDAIDGPAKLTVRPFLSYPTPQLSPADVSGFAAAQADYLRLITTLNVGIDPGAVTPSSVAFAVSFPVVVAANTVEPAALRPLQASDFVVTAPAGATVTLTGSGVAYTLTVSGLRGGNYAVTARLPARAAIDPATGRLTAASNTATVPGPLNAAPTIVGTLADQLVVRGGFAPTQSFTVGDDSTPAGNLTVTATSSNPAFVPAANVVILGSGADRTVEIGPDRFTPHPYPPYPSGSSVITVTVTDAEGLATSRSFRVERPDTPPRIEPIPDILLPRGPEYPLVFSVDDDESPNSDLTFVVTSSHPEVLAASDTRTYYGSGNKPAYFYAENAHVPGSTVVTLTFTDPQGLSASRSFLATFTHSPPTITGALPDLTLGMGTTTVVPFIAKPADIAFGSVTVTSSNLAVVPAASLKLLESYLLGRDNSVTIANLPGVAGSSTITLTAFGFGYGGLTTTRSFVVTVPNAAPTLAGDFADQSVGLAPRAGPFGITVGDDATPAADLVLSATSSDDTVVPAAGFVFGGTGPNRTLTLTGLPGKPGVSTVTVRVADAQGLVTARAFAVSVTGVAPPPPPTNAAPTVTAIPDQAIPFGGAAPFLAFTVGDDATPAANLTITVTSSNPAVALPLIDPAVGTGANRTLSVGSVPGASGSSVITVTVTDAQGLSTSRSFAVTVPPPVVTPQRTRLFAVGADAGGRPEVQVFGADGQVRSHFLVFEPGFTGGVRVATADFDGDGTDDLVVAAGPGGGPRVRVLSGATGAALADFFAFDAAFRGGVTVAAADVTGTGVPSIVVGAGPGGGPHVKVISLGGAVAQSFFAFDAGFTGGVNVAAADLDGDGRAEVVAAAGPGGGPHVKAFGFATGGPVVTRSYFAFDAGFRGGVFVAAGTFGVAAAQGVGGTNEIRLSGGGKFVAYESVFTGGVRLGSYDFNGDGTDEILAAPGAGGGPRVQAFTPAGGAAFNAFAFDNAARSGYFIG